MRSFMPACSISTPAMPRSATLSISSRISLKFKSDPSHQFVAQQMLRARQLESCAAVIAVRPEHEEDVILRSDCRKKGDVLLGHEGKLKHLAGVELRVGDPHRLDEAAELRAHRLERHRIVAHRLHGDAVE